MLDHDNRYQDAGGVVRSQKSLVNNVNYTIHTRLSIGTSFYLFPPVPRLAYATLSNFSTRTQQRPTESVWRDGEPKKKINLCERPKFCILQTRTPGEDGTRGADDRTTGRHSFRNLIVLESVRFDINSVIMVH